MTEITIHVDGITDALDIPFHIRDWLEANAAILTDEHPTASRGLPVLVKNGVAYGPGDLPTVTLFIGNTEATGVALIETARAAGWSVRVVEL